MPNANISISVAGLGSNINQQFSRTAEGGSALEVPMPAGKSGTLSTRNDNDTGIATLGSGHGIADTDRVDVYWDGGARTNMDVTATDSTTVSINGGDGDNLPVQTTAIVVTKRVRIEAAIDGDALVFMAIAMIYADPSITSQSHVDFWEQFETEVSSESAGGEITDLDLGPNEPRLFDIYGGDANPFTGLPIARLYASNGSGTAAGTLKLMWLADPTP